MEHNAERAAEGQAAHPRIRNLVAERLAAGLDPQSLGEDLVAAGMPPAQAMAVVADIRRSTARLQGLRLLVGAGLLGLLAAGLASGGLMRMTTVVAVACGVTLVRALIAFGRAYSAMQMDLADRRCGDLDQAARNPQWLAQVVRRHQDQGGRAFRRVVLAAALLLALGYLLTDATPAQGLLLAVPCCLVALAARGIRRVAQRFTGKALAAIGDRTTPVVWAFGHETRIFGMALHSVAIKAVHEDGKREEFALAVPAAAVTDALRVIAAHFPGAAIGHDPATEKAWHKHPQELYRRRAQRCAAARMTG